MFYKFLDIAIRFLYSPSPINHAIFHEKEKDNLRYASVFSNRGRSKSGSSPANRFHSTRGIALKFIMADSFGSTEGQIMLCGMDLGTARLTHVFATLKTLRGVL